MSDKIKPFLGPATPPFKQDVLKALDKLRTQVDNNETLACLVISVGPENTFRFEMAGDVTYVNLIGMLEVVKHDFIKALPKE